MYSGSELSLPAIRDQNVQNKTAVAWSCKEYLCAQTIFGAFCEEKSHQAQICIYR